MDNNVLKRHAEKEVQKLNKQLLEVRSVVVGLGQKVTEQQDVIQHLNERIRKDLNTLIQTDICTATLQKWFNLVLTSMS